MYLEGLSGSHVTPFTHGDAWAARSIDISACEHVSRMYVSRPDEIFYKHTTRNVDFDVMQLTNVDKHRRACAAWLQRCAWLLVRGVFASAMLPCSSSTGQRVIGQRVSVS